MTRMTSGFRFTTGRWMNKQQTIGFVGRGWYGGRKQFNFERNQSQTPTLLRPFLDFTDQFTPTPETQVIAEPGRADGSVVVNADSEAYGGDLAFRRFSALITERPWIYSTVTNSSGLMSDLEFRPTRCHSMMTLHRLAQPFRFVTPSKPRMSSTELKLVCKRSIGKTTGLSMVWSKLPLVH